MTTTNYIRISIMEIRTLELLNEIKGLIQDKVSDRWLCIRDVCEYASVSESTVRRSIKRGALKASHSTGKLLFKVSSVDKWLKG
jgi:excisionase family DNA binding protein